MNRWLQFFFLLLGASAFAHVPEQKVLSPIPRSGAHTLAATAYHVLGLTSTSTNYTFNNNQVDQTTLSYFSEGQMSSRVWKNISNVVVRTQSFRYDAKGRLLKMTERDAGNNGYNWEAVYDPLGRKIRTTTFVVTNSAVITSQPKTIKQYYDPEHRFLELAVEVDGKKTWKLMGPDANGRYGGLNGINSLDGVIDDIGLFRPVVSDVRGNLLASYYFETGLKWNAARPTGYGAIPEHRPIALVNHGDLIKTSTCQNRWAEAKFG